MLTDSLNVILFFIFVFVFGVWSGTTFIIWQMSKSKYKTISEYIEFNYPKLYQRWYKDKKQNIQ